MTASTSTAIAERPPIPAALPADVSMQEGTLNTLWREAQALAAGRMFKNVVQAEQAFAKLVIGHHLGLNPSQSMLGIDIVEGNAQLRGVLMGTLVRARDGYDWKVLEFTNDKCKIEFFRDGESQGISEWSEEDSQRAELAKERSNHKKYPRAMFWNRAMSQGVKLLVPEVMSGIPVYVPEDLEAIDVGAARDGEPGGQRTLESSVNEGALESALRDFIPEALVDEAMGVLREANRAAPNSWTPAKIQIVFSGKESERALRRELEAIAKSTAEIRERRRVTGDPEPEPEMTPVEATSVEAAEPRHAAQVEELQRKLNEGSDLSDEERSAAEDELDLLTTEIDWSDSDGPDLPL